MSKVFVNGHDVGIFSASYDNPFQRHYTKGANSRYLGVTVPKEYLITGD